MGNMKSLARVALSSLVNLYKEGTVPEGENRPTYWTFKDARPQWVFDLFLKAHEDGDMLGDDYRFDLIRTSLERIASSPADMPSHQLRTQVGGLPSHYEGQEDITYSELGEWWVSSKWRDQYATDAIASGRKHSTITDILQHAQRIEMARTFGQVLTELAKLASNPPKEAQYVDS